MRFPPATWLELCRIAEGQQNYERAVSEYERLAQAYPNERQSLLALLSAGRLALKQLQRPSDALLYYKAAKASKVPHLDWESNIQAGIQDARSEEHTSELQSQSNLVCRLLLEKKKNKANILIRLVHPS